MTGSAARWTLTLYPSNQARESKTRTQDLTVAIGSTAKRRAWLATLCQPLANRHHPSKTLLGLDVKRYNELLHLARKLAGLDPSSPHRLRHGGASADALLENDEKITDLEIASRGRWQSLASIRRYRQPATYLRALQGLTPAQLRAAKGFETTLPAQLRRYLKMKSS